MSCTVCLLQACLSLRDSNNFEVAICWWKALAKLNNRCLAVVKFRHIWSMADPYLEIQQWYFLTTFQIQKPSRLYRKKHVSNKVSVEFLVDIVLSKIRDYLNLLTK